MLEVWESQQIPQAACVQTALQAQLPQVCRAQQVPLAAACLPAQVLTLGAYAASQACASAPAITLQHSADSPGQKLGAGMACKFVPSTGSGRLA